MLAGERLILEYRFFINKSIQSFADAILGKYGRQNERAILFPSRAVSDRCVDFFRQQAPSLAQSKVRIIELVPNEQRAHSMDVKAMVPKVFVVLFPEENYSIAKAFWQHSGDGTSSRRAVYCHQLFDEGLLVESSEAESAALFCRGPRRYRSSVSSRPSSPMSNGAIPQAAEMLSEASTETRDPAQFVEERFGRNLDFSLAAKAKLAVRRRIAGSLTADVELKEALEMRGETSTPRQASGFSEDDVYLFPTGMSSIFNSHQALLAARGEMKSICYGYVFCYLKTLKQPNTEIDRFPYIDTLKILEKFGPGCLFYGLSSSDELDDLERRLQQGERFLALFTEFPGNPLLKSPNLLRIRQLADKYDFGVVVDETIGNFVNVHVLPYADVVVSSLTKVFSGDSNVMGGR